MKKSRSFLSMLGPVGYLVIALVILATCSILHAEGWDVKEMNRQIDQTNFLVNDNCSATLIDKDRGLLLTANHCIQSQFRTVEREKIEADGKVTTEKVRVAREGTVSQLLFKNASEVQRTTYVFKIIASDHETDLALIQVKVKLPNAEAAKLACNEPQRGETVYAVGNPFAVLYSSLTRGIVSSIDRNYKMIFIDDQGDHTLIQSSAVIFGGNSGGALYNESGELVGVNVRGTPGITLSVPVTDVKEMLKQLGMGDLFKGCT